jgi:putative spermidine/putrescine transport system permease protein
MTRELRASLGLGRLPFIVLGLLTAVFLLLPLLIIVPTSWSESQFVEFPPPGFSLQWYEQAFQDPAWTDAIKTSLGISLWASLIATVMGTAAALGMRRLAAGRAARVARSLFILPLAIPYVAYALGVYNIFDRVAVDLLDSRYPLILSQSMISFPLVYVVVSGAIAGIDPRLGRAAATLGARWPTIVWKIELPLIRAAIFGGWIFAFALCFDEATLPLFLAPVTETTLAQQLFSSAQDTAEPTLSAVSTVITTAAIIVMTIGSLFVARAAARASAVKTTPEEEASA